MFARVPVRPMLLRSLAVAWLLGYRNRSRQLQAREKRLGTFGSLPVYDRSSSVECCLPLVLVHIVHP
jgi:hypothetical protein